MSTVSTGHSPKRLIVAITGASGSTYGLRALEILRSLPDWESHLVVSEAGILNTMHEHGLGRKDMAALADQVYHPSDVGAAIASGSFLTQGMLIAPASMKTLAAVAHAFADNLVTRAADVVLKERRRLVMMTRETPLNLAHLRNMTSVTEMGGIIFPPVPAFYTKSTEVAELVDHSVRRALELFGIHSPQISRWSGLKRGALREDQV